MPPDVSAAAPAAKLTASAPPHVHSDPAAKSVPPSPALLQERRAALAAHGVRIEQVAAEDGYLDLFGVLRRLAELEVNEVLVEAGPTLAGQLMTTFFADELLLYIAPKLLGPQGRPLVNLPELQSLQDAWGFSLFDAKRFGDDLRLRLRPK
jgi:diaminohydroxyphosphoribosylaminopyrimidine deaminase/5-amino-6-(5-phosphoribosylamino)uracil reductase